MAYESRQRGKLLHIAFGSHEGYAEGYGTFFAQAHAVEKVEVFQHLVGQAVSFRGTALYIKVIQRHPQSVDAPLDKANNDIFAKQSAVCEYLHCFSRCRGFFEHIHDSRMEKRLPHAAEEYGFDRFRHGIQHPLKICKIHVADWFVEP